MSVRHRLSHPREQRPGSDNGKLYPRLVIEAQGIDDVYRLARHMEIGQVEFAEIGYRTLKGLDRKYPGIVRKQGARMGPAGRGYPGRKPRMVK